MSDHDAEVLVKKPDDSRVPDTGLVVWSWTDGRRTVTPTEHEEMTRVIATAEGRFDLTELASGDVLARVWMDSNERIRDVDWLR